MSEQDYHTTLIAVGQIRSAISILMNLSINDDYCGVEEQLEDCIGQLEEVYAFMQKHNKEKDKSLSAKGSKEKENE